MYRVVLPIFNVKVGKGQFYNKPILDHDTPITNGVFRVNFRIVWRSYFTKLRLVDYFSYATTRICVV